MINKLGCDGSYRAACSIIPAYKYTTLQTMMFKYYVNKAVEREVGYA